MGVQRPPHVDLFAALGAAPDDLKVAGDGAALLVVEEAGLLVADPGMGTTAARVDPEDVAEAKVVAQGGVDDLDGHDHEAPAAGADVGLVAAGTDLVVVGQVDVEAELLGEGPEGRGRAQGLAVARVRAVDGADLEARRQQAQHVLAQEVGRREGLVAQVRVVGQREGELAVPEVVGRRRAVVQPLEQVPPREQPLVKRPHQLRVRRLQRDARVSAAARARARLAGWPRSSRAGARGRAPGEGKGRGGGEHG